MTGWLGYFDDLREHATFRLEAEEFAQRLGRAVPLSPAMRVLDFGCGFGFVARALAPAVREVVLWDGAPRMRARAAATLAGVGNARVVDALSPYAVGRFDLIVVNSVVQYMTPTEVRVWLLAWKGLLTDHGRLVVADVLPEHEQLHRDLLDQVAFSVRRGILLGSLRRGVLEMLRYAPSRQARPLTRFGRPAIEALAAGAGMRVEFLARNLTCRSARLSALFTLPGADGARC